MSTAWPGFVSLNGPDNVGKTTQLRLLAQLRSGFQPLGAIHDHDPEPWERVAAGDYGRWWFETSTTVELTGMLLAGHAKRAAAWQAGRTVLLDRGLPRLLAVAAATCAVKEQLPLQQALDIVAGIAGAYPRPPETAVLLIPALDAQRSYAIASAREGRPWTGVYPAYQKTLHAVLDRPRVGTRHHHGLRPRHRRPP
ncbi:hypothetical protein PV416_28180 [Streptomyces ipomoeae]|uniref:hypothetical protein n=1 Tax=Streptomyces ipomoeae TaxID=103232 RepID=UPI00215CA608|nr:hypothetical protein [Streptomyces ipomoeae]MDX2697259.1 hypothetical protein [Streptomyces ipomoeae]MDX2824866.1 hypothetical protein [Streptomyces ipomoeae]MDX2843149.1 hypothetical protein [Streptomyces ipomoeae]